MKLLYSVVLGLALIWLALSQLSGQEIAAAALLNSPTILADTPYPLMFTTFTQTAKLTASNRITNDGFGRIAIDGDTIIVGAPGKDTVFVFVNPDNGWSGALTEAARLIPSGAITGVNYGFAVAISGNTVVVGASSESNRGSIYIYVKPAGGWSGTLTEAAKLTASDGTDFSYFGYSVAIYSDTVVVGAPGGNSGRGAAYIFAKPAGGWVTTSTFTAKLTASDGANGDFLGDKVDLTDSTIAASAPGDNSRTGSIYIFNKPALGWVTTSTFTAKLTASDGAANDGLGYSLGLSQDTMVAGAVGDDNFTGSAYIFAKPTGGWVTTSTFSAKLTSSDRSVNDYFGTSAGITNDVVVVGAWGDDSGLSTDQGSAYIFVKPSGGWGGLLTETTQLTASDGAANDGFGIAVAAEDSLLGVGAAGADNGKGSAYLFISDALNPSPKLPTYLPVIPH